MVLFSEVLYLLFRNEQRALAVDFLSLSSGSSSCMKHPLVHSANFAAIVGGGFYCKFVKTLMMTQ